MSEIRQDKIKQKDEDEDEDGDKDGDRQINDIKKSNKKQRNICFECALYGIIRYDITFYDDDTL